MVIAPKYNLEDIVVYNGAVYKITRVYALNWFQSAPFVYGLVLAHQAAKEPLEHRELIVLERLIEYATPKQIITWKLLYGSNE